MPRRSVPATAGAVLLGAALVAAAAVVGQLLRAGGTRLYAPAAPLVAVWDPRLAPATVLAVGTGAAVVAVGPRLLGVRLRVALPSVWILAVAWSLALALLDGWDPGVVGRLTTATEYLAEVPTVPPLRDLLEGFVARVSADAADPWVTHVAGHPPGALLTFVAMARLGLDPGATALVVVAVAATAGPAVAVTLRSLGAPAHAARAALFVAAAPTAVWAAVSADGLFAAVAAWGLALLAVGDSGRGPGHAAAAFGGGLLLGWAVFCSYGLVLLAPLALVAGLRHGSVRPVLLAAAGAGVVAIAFTAGGFAWWEGLAAVRERYAAGVASERPYAYWVWANLAALVVATGPAAVAGWTRVPAGLRRAAPSGERVVAALVLAAGTAVLAATVSGLSKGEVERIWLPWACWLVVAAALLPTRWLRGWLAAQVATGLAVAHLLVTPW